MGCERCHIESCLAAWPLAFELHPAKWRLLKSFFRRFKENVLSGLVIFFRISKRGRCYIFFHKSFVRTDKRIIWLLRNSLFFCTVHGTSPCLRALYLLLKRPLPCCWYRWSLFALFYSGTDVCRTWETPQRGIVLCGN